MAEGQEVIVHPDSVLGQKFTKTEAVHGGVKKTADQLMDGDGVIDGEWKEVAPANGLSTENLPEITLGDLITPAAIITDELIEAAQKRKGGNEDERSKPETKKSQETSKDTDSVPSGKNENKKETFDWGENDRDLMKIVRKEKVRPLSPRDEALALDLTEKRDGYWDEHKGEHITSQDKKTVGDLVHSQIEHYDRDKAVVGLDSGDPLSSVLEEVDRKISVYSSEAQNDPVKVGWWRGVRINIEKKCLEAELKASKRALIGDAEELEERIEELKIESKYLVWGNNKEASQGQWRRLASKHVEWLATHDAEYVRAEAMARVQVGSGGDTAEILRRLLEQMSNREVRIVEDEINDWTQYDQDFLKAHGLPSHIYIPVGVELHRRDMRTALALASNIGEFTGLSPENFIRGLIEDEKDKIRRNGERVELPRDVLEEITVQGQEAYKEFVEGIIPMIVVRKKDAGTFSSLVGQKEPKPNASPEQVRGALGVANFDLKMTARAYLRDPMAMDILGTWLAIRGREVADLSDKGGELARAFGRRVEEMNSQNDTYLTRDRATGVTKDIAERLASEFNVKPGLVADMQELSNLLVEGPEMQDFRTKKLKKKNKVLWDKKFRREVLGRDGEEEMAFAPVIEKVVYTELRFKNGLPEMETVEGETRQKMKKVPKFLSSGLESDGVGGTDGLLARIEKLNNGQVFQFQYAQMRNLTDGMDVVNEYIEGKDNFPNSDVRRKKIAELVEPWTGGDAPMLGTIDTVEAIKKMPIYVGKGAAAEAGDDFLSREKAGLQGSLESVGLGGLARVLGNKDSRLRKFLDTPLITLPGRKPRK